MKPETGGKEGRDSNGYIFSLCTVVNYICLTRNMALRSFLVFFKDKDVMKSEEKRIGPNEIKFKKSCQRCILMRLMSEAITMRFVKEMSTKMF